MPPSPASHWSAEPNPAITWSLPFLTAAVYVYCTIVTILPNLTFFSLVSWSNPTITWSLPCSYCCWIWYHAADSCFSLVSWSKSRHHLKLALFLLLLNMVPCCDSCFLLVCWSKPNHHLVLTAAECSTILPTPADPSPAIFWSLPCSY